MGAAQTCKGRRRGVALCGCGNAAESPCSSPTHRSSPSSTGFSPVSDWAKQRERELRHEACGWHAPEDIEGLPMVEDFPVVDLAPFLSGAPGGKDAAVSQLRHACEVVGFYHVIGWGDIVSEDLVDKAFLAAKQYFQRPMEDKMRDHVDTGPATERARGCGYLPVGSRMLPRREHGNLVESFILSNHTDRIQAAREAAIAEGRTYIVPGTKFQVWGPQAWPGDLGEEWKQVILTYTDAMSKLSKVLIELIAVALGLPEDFFHELMEADPGHLWRLRMSRYPVVAVTDRKAGQFGFPPHVDTSLITIVASREPKGRERGTEEPGLAFQCDALGGWVRPPSRPGAMLVNSGETLKMITNDLWPSARHYVANPTGDEERPSLAFFLAGSPEVPMKVAPTCETSARPALYRPTTWREGLGADRGGFLLPADVVPPSAPGRP